MDSKPFTSVWKVNDQIKDVIVQEYGNCGIPLFHNLQDSRWPLNQLAKLTSPIRGGSSNWKVTTSLKCCNKSGVQIKVRVKAILNM